MANIPKTEREEQARIRALFESQPFDPADEAVAEDIRKQFQKLAITVHKGLRPGRHKSLAITALEDAAMRVNKSLGHDKSQPAASEALDTAVADSNEDIKNGDNGATRLGRRGRKPAEATVS